jgi:hypothetical protein
MAIEKYKYKILSDKRLIIKYFCGSFTKPDIIKWMNETVQDRLFDPSFSVLNDYRDADSSIKTKEIHEFVDFLWEDKISYGKRKSAFLTNTPNQTVFTTLLGQFNHEELIKIKTFSTLIAAVEWLGLQPSDLETIEDILEDLKKYSNSIGIIL